MLYFSRFLVVSLSNTNWSENIAFVWSSVNFVWLRKLWNASSKSIKNDAEENNFSFFPEWREWRIRLKKYDILPQR